MVWVKLISVLVALCAIVALGFLGMHLFVNKHPKIMKSVAIGTVAGSTILVVIGTVLLMI